MSMMVIDLPELSGEKERPEKPIDWQHADDWLIDGIEKDPSNEHVIEMVNVLNTYLLETVNPEADTPKSIKSAAADIVSTLLTYQFQTHNNIFVNLIDEAGKIPLIISIGTAEKSKQVKDEQMRCESKCRKLPLRSRQSLDKICDFIYGMNELVLIYFFGADGHIRILNFYPSLIGDDLVLSKGEVRSHLIKINVQGGSFIMRVGNDLYGGVVRDKRFRKASVEELKSFLWDVCGGNREHVLSYHYKLFPFDLY